MNIVQNIRNQFFNDLDTRRRYMGAHIEVHEPNTLYITPREFHQLRAEAHIGDWQFFAPGTPPKFMGMTIVLVSEPDGHVHVCYREVAA